MVKQVLLLAVASTATASAGESQDTANPVRKVVNLLQAMQKKVESEREKANQLYDKFMCYCQTSGGDLQTSVTAAEAKIPELASSIKAATSRKTQLEADLKSHQSDRSSAKKAMAEATSLREKEKASYDAELAENTANLAAMRKAANAIEKGMAGSFLQTPAAEVLRKLVTSRQSMLNADRQEILSFLSGQQSGEYAPASGEIAGILKTMADEMAADQKDMMSTEKTAVETYEALMAAKKKEVTALTQSIEEKTKRVGDLGIEIVTLKNDAEDTAESLEEDKKFSADLEKNCAEKTSIHEREQKVRAEEVVAIADTINILNSDDALDLFKKTLPSASSSFLQTEKMEKDRRAEAIKMLSTSGEDAHPRVDFIMLALRGRKVGFEKVVKLIDNLVATLKTEQEDDESKKEYCEVQFDQTEDKIKGLGRSISDLETVIEDTKEGIATLADEIKALKISLVALDKQVAEATEQRKAEAVEYNDLMKSNSAAKELILFAKNRMNKFYNPAMYKAPPKRELSEGDQIYVNQGGDIPTAAPGGISNTGVTAFVQLSGRKDAPPPPPATAAAYTKKAGESGGVIAMMDLLVKDLDEEMTVAKTEEKNAQAEYEKTVADAADKRRKDSKSLIDKEAAKADSESTLERSIADKKTTGRALMGTQQYLASLHAECDWLMKYYSVRKEARADEIDSLGKAKAVLSGASYSFLEHARTGRFLRGA